MKKLRNFFHIKKIVIVVTSAQMPNEIIEEIKVALNADYFILVYSEKCITYPLKIRYVLW